MEESNQCKAKVWTGPRPQGLMSHRCRRKAIKDGYCKIHHPDEVKRRQEKIGRRLAATPFNMIHRY